MKHLRQHRPIRLSGNKTKGVNYALYVSHRWRPSTRAIVREKERIPEIDRPRCKNSLGRIVWVDLRPSLAWNAHFGSMHHSCFRNRASKRIFLRRSLRQKRTSAPANYYLLRDARFKLLPDYFLFRNSSVILNEGFLDKKFRDPIILKLQVTENGISFGN